MSASFLTTTIADMRVEVSVAWGADLTDLDGSSWTWSDVTADVVLGGQAHSASSGITITIGRPDFSQETQTAVMTCQLDNRDSAYSEGGMSANWPNVRRGTPVRVRVSTNAGAAWSLRFQGQANGFTPQWDAETGRWATVELSASGPLRRLNQGTGLMISAMREGTLADSSVIAYLPMEDQQNATFIAPAVGTAVGQWAVMDQVTKTLGEGSPGECASYADIPSSAPVVTFGEGGGMNWNVPDAATTSVTFTGFFGNVPSLKPYDYGATLNKYGVEQVGNIFIVRTANASAIKAWAVSAWPDGKIWLSCYSTASFFFNVNPVKSLLYFNLRDNTPYEIGLSLSQSGSTTNFRIFRRQLGTNNVEAGTDSQSGNSNGATVTEVTSAAGGDTQGLTAGHFVLRNTAVNELYDKDWANGYPGETVDARLTRLCEGHGIGLTIIDTSVVESSTSITETMGPQFYDTLTALLRECELTGQGLLYDGIGAGLTYVTKSRRAANANGPATLVIDASAAQMMEPFAPIDDDQVTINHCDVTRRNGTVNSYMDRTGPMGVNEIGDYTTSYTANPVTDDGLNHYAEWTVGIGTQAGYRYPSVSFALETNPGLVAGWLACLPQSRIDVTNVTAIRRQHPDETIKLLLEGWQESIDAFTWRVTANTSSAVPWNVARLAAATGSTGDGICHMDTDGSQLNANAAAAATSIAVKTISGPLWVTTAVDADSFPFDLDVGGCKVSVTAIGAATSSVQTFTLASPGLPRAFTGSTTNGAGTPVKVWRPPVFGL